MDIWNKLYEKAKQEYHPEDVSPFVFMDAIHYKVKENHKAHAFSLSAPFLNKKYVYYAV